MGNELLTGFLAGQSDNNGNNVGNGGGFFGNEGLWAVIILAIIFGWGNNGNGFGNRNGGGSGGDNVTVVPYPVSGSFGGYPTEAILQRSLDTQTVIGKLDGITQGVCDSTYALSNAINSNGNANQMAMMQGFNGVDRAVCTLGYQNQAGFSALGNQLASCCCETKSAIGDVKYQMATDTCAIQNTIQSTTRDIIDNQNANYRGLMDFMVQRDMDALRTENQNLKLAASQANQNAAIGAMISASEATILRRTGAECPTAAYVVQPPTPVSFPVNGCGNFAGWNNGWGNSGGCGNGCGSCC